MTHRWKQTVACLLSLSMAFSLLCGSAWAADTTTEDFPVRMETQSGTCGEDLRWTLDDAGTLTISGTGDMSAFGENRPWYSSSDGASAIKKVVIKSGVTSISDYAFSGCPNLESVTIADSVRRIGNYAFHYGGYYYTEPKSKLRKIVIPSSVNYIGGDLFGYNEAIDVYFMGSAPTFEVVEHNVYDAGNADNWTEYDYIFTGKGHTDFDSDGYERCYATVYYPEGDDTWTEEIQTKCGSRYVTWNTWNPDEQSDEDEPFSGSGSCGENLTWELDTEGTMTISGTGDMDNYSFEKDPPWYEGKQAVKRIVVSEGATSIGDSAFNECTELVALTLPNSLTRIGKEAFSGCEILPEVRFPEHLTNIGEQAFINCYELTEIIIPDSVITVGEYAFYACSKLSSVILPDPIPTLGESVFSETPWAEAHGFATGTCGEKLVWKLYDHVLTINGEGSMQDWELEYGDVNENVWHEKYRDDIYEVRIESGVTDVGAGAFFECKNLNRVQLSDSVTWISKDAFRDCTALTDIALPAGVEQICPAFIGCKSLKEVTIPASNKYFTVEDGVIYNKNKTTIVECLPGRPGTKLSIPTSVKKIHYGSFHTCEHLKNIYFIGKAPYISCDYDEWLEPFYGVTATVYYPGGDTTWAKDIRRDYHGKLTWKPWSPDGKKVTQTITAKNFTKTLGDKSFKLNAKTSGTGKLTYTSSKPKVAAVSGAGVVTLKSAGTAKITIKAAENAYCKAAVKTVTIKVKAITPTTISNLTNSKGKKLKVTWKKVKGISGYEIQYSTSAKFKKPNKATTKAAVTNKTLSNLTRKKKYYVRVRTYRALGKNKFYSKWSGFKSITIKK